MMVSMDYKYSYADEFMLNKNSNGLGFFANNLDFFFYELPVSLVVLLVLLLIFKLLFNYRVSRYFRKYAFAGVFLFVLYEGITKKRPNKNFEKYTNLIGFIMLLSLAAIITVNDVVKLFKK